MSGQQIEGLLFDEARAYVTNIELQSRENLFAWKEGWPDWRPVHEVEGLNEAIYRIMHVAPPPPPKGTSESSLLVSSKKIPGLTPVSLAERPARQDQEAFPQVDGEGLIAIATETGEFTVRAKQRFKSRMNVTVLGPNGEQFKTSTRDVSVGGLFLEASLPSWATGHFKVRLQRQGTKQQIELLCAAVESQSPDARFRVAIIPLESIADEKSLEAWLSAA